MTARTSIDKNAANNPDAKKRSVSNSFHANKQAKIRIGKKRILIFKSKKNIFNRRIENTINRIYKSE
jgi:hypothetical protein